MAPIGGNRLLASLSPSTQVSLVPLLRRVDLPLGTVLYEHGEAPAEAYFLESGFASQVIDSSDGGSAEVGMIGFEGVVGAIALLGPPQAPGRCFMQASGAGFVLSLPLLKQGFDRSEDLRNRVLEFVQGHILTGTYLGACNKLHDTEPRLARWLLMVQDRLQTEVLPLRQEFLAQMLGTRRMTVTLAAGALQRSELIQYARGQVRILDRPSLEAAACACYTPVAALFRNLYGG